MEEAGSGHEDSSHNLTLDALQVLSRSQVTLELSMSMRIRPICKSLHTYIPRCRYFWASLTEMHFAPELKTVDHTNLTQQNGASQPKK
jgi:hypothetical protein